MSLKEYEKKRNFNVTPEPGPIEPQHSPTSAAASSVSSGTMLRICITISGWRSMECWSVGPFRKAPALTRNANRWP